MKIGVSSYSFFKYMKDTGCDYLEICDIAKEVGFDGIEFINLNSKSLGIDTDELELAKDIRNHCEEIGLEIAAYTVSANLLSDDMCKEIARLKVCIDVCDTLGAKVFRHDTTFALRNKHLYSYKDAIAEMAPFIRELSDYAASKGIRTCSENHGWIFQDPKRVEELILAVNHENYGWLCDMGNFLCADCDPAESVRIAASYAFHVHAKDFLLKPSNEPTPFGRWIPTVMGNYLRGTVIGHGIVPVKQCVNILKKAGYDGYVSLEFEGAEDNLYAIKTGYEYLRSVVS